MIKYKHKHNATNTVVLLSTKQTESDTRSGNRPMAPMHLHDGEGSNLNSKYRFEDGTGPHWLSVFLIVWLQHLWMSCSVGTPDICQSHQSRRECKKFHVGGIFSYWTRKGPLWNSVHCAVLHTYVTYCVWFYTQCVILHTVYNFTHSV